MSRRETIEDDGPMSQDLLEADKPASNHVKQDSTNTNTSTESGSGAKGMFFREWFLRGLTHWILDAESPRIIVNRPVEDTPVETPITSPEVALKSSSSAENNTGTPQILSPEVTPKDDDKKNKRRSQGEERGSTLNFLKRVFKGKDDEMEKKKRKSRPSVYERSTVVGTRDLTSRDPNAPPNGTIQR